MKHPAVFENWVYSAQYSAEKAEPDMIRAAVKTMMNDAAEAGVQTEGYVYACINLREIEKRDIVITLLRELLGSNIPALSIVQEAALADGAEFNIQLIGTKENDAVRYGVNGEGVPAAVKAGEYVYTSAMVAPLTGTFEEQAHAALQAVVDAAALAGAQPGNFVKNLITLKDCGQFGAFNEVYKTFFTMPEPPSRTLYGIEDLPTGSDISAEGIAYLGTERHAFNIVGNTSPGLPFCQAMQAGELLFISGQVGIMGGDGQYILEFGPQSTMMERIVYAIGNGSHARPDQFIKYNVYVRDMANRDTFLGIHDPAAPDCSVAALTQVTGLAHPAILVEMDAICSVKHFRKLPFDGEDFWPEDLQTPAVVIDEKQLDANIAEYQQAVEKWGCSVRPHIKTHKIPEIALKQMKAGAVGIVCSKISEAEVFADAGINNIFIAYPIIGKCKLARLAELNKRVEKLYVEVESLEGAKELSEAAAEFGQTFHVICNVDVAEYGRVGFPLDTAVDSILTVSGMNGLQVNGVYAYAYMNIHGGRGAINALEAGKAEGQMIVGIADELRARGLKIDIVAGGSAPTGRYTAMVPGVTEVHPGTHVFYDAMAFFYGIVPQEYAARVVVTVVASNDKRIVIDGGSKTFSTDLMPDVPPLNLNGYGYVVEDQDLRFDHMSEEHGILKSKSGKPLNIPIGTKLSIVPNHICPCIALHDEVYMHKDGVLRKVKVAARGKVI